jgi:hypothetical protein
MMVLTTSGMTRPENLTGNQAGKKAKAEPMMPNKSNGLSQPHWQIVKSRPDRTSHAPQHRCTNTHQTSLEQKWRTKRSPPFLSDPGTKTGRAAGPTGRQKWRRAPTEHPGCSASDSPAKRKPLFPLPGRFPSRDQVGMGDRDADSC